MADLTLVRDYIQQIYGPETVGPILGGLEAMLRAHASTKPRQSPHNLTEAEAFLITYPDQVRDAGDPPLSSLEAFASQYLEGLVSGLHVLPFYPSSSDDGFSVQDYRSVDPAYGGWDDIERLRGRFRLMFDAVVNHASAQGGWFQAFLRDESPYDKYFLSVSGNPDLSKVVRPRTSPLLTRFSTARGPQDLWTTFGPDQVDLDYHNPAVLLEMLDVLLFYVDQGASFIRLDAIAYAWKDLGTSCIHRPKVHSIVRLIRALLDQCAPHVRLLTETNVGHPDNVSYFGDGTNEAHLVYNFALPTLLLHAFQSGQASTLTDWAASLAWPAGGSAFFNVLATHDGIGLNAAHGILKESAIQALIDHAEERSARISSRSNRDGTSSAYEINANYYDVLATSAPGQSTKDDVYRFIAAHAIMLALKGLPGLYFHSMFGSRGWGEGVRQTGMARSINRQKLEHHELAAELANPGSLRARIYHGMSRLLMARRRSAAFSPDSQQRVLRVEPGIFACTRSDPTVGEQVLCVHNVTQRAQTFPCSAWKVDGRPVRSAMDLLSSRQLAWDAMTRITLEPYESMWFRMIV